MEYELVTCTSFDFDESIDDFVNSVNEKLAAGWKLQGGVACYPIPECEGCTFFAQAIVRDEKDRDSLTVS